MKNSLGIRLSQPVPLGKREIKVNTQELFKSIGKAVADGAFGNWNNLSLDLVETVAALGLGTTEGELAWKLVCKATLKAIASLLQDNRELFIYVDEERALKSKSLDLPLGDSELQLDTDFFTNPKQSPVVGAMQEWCQQWLEPMLQKPIEAEMISGRFPSYFVFALHEEWQENGKDYGLLTEKLSTPFTQAAVREESWARYGAWLQKQVEEPMFLEAFGLKQVYVPLCAYYTRQSKKPNLADEWQESGSDRYKKEERVVVDLEEELNSWLTKGERLDALRLISGGPGSGKSSFTKMWAAKLAETSSIPVLYIPLHQFSAELDLVEAVSDFVKNGKYLAHNPLDADQGEDRLLIFFDGLDELAMQGKVGSETAKSFVEYVAKKITLLNDQKTRLQVVISGRDLVVQASSDTLRQEGQVLYVLPYFVPDKESTHYTDGRGLLDTDRRNDWWQKYGTVSGIQYAELPNELKIDNLREITAQPLLNYLVALSYRGGRLDFSAQTNLNQIYADLLTAIYERGWAEKRRHPGTEGMSQDQFERVLEEIALSSWHGDGRTTTVSAIERHCNSTRSKQLLAVFQEGAKAGLTRLLTAFYFRQSGVARDGDKTFEFTHKSFGEYLAARHIVREMGLIHKKMQQKQDDPDEGWDEKEALTAWANLCGATAIDEYLFRFIADEVELRYRDNSDLVCQWQKTLCDLIGFMLRHGMPMEKLDPRPSYHEESRQARNAEEALLLVLNTCARSTQEISKIQWSAPEAFGAWIARLQGQRASWENSLLLLCLSYLNLENCNLLARDFYRANLLGANLLGANLQGANLQGANLQGADLLGANLQGADLLGANLQGADLLGANLQGADLLGANLQGADLLGADLLGISWDKYTEFQLVNNLDKALNVPQQWSDK